MDPRKEVAFHCRACGNKFRGEPDQVEAEPELEEHPYRYWADCPECGAEAFEAGWWRNLFKAWRNATGPRTPEGKAASAANLEGHPTPEEALRTRFNALRHGMSARTATYFPARPGKYPMCDGCEHNPIPCLQETACLKNVELYMRHHVAFESGDPGALTAIRAETHAGIQTLINWMIQTIAADGGPRIRDIQWYYDKDGALHLARWTDQGGQTHQIYELKAHPLLKPLIEFVQKAGMTLGDMGMTPKVQDEHELLEGHLAGQNQDRTAALEHQTRQSKALEDLREMINKSREQTARDPVLIEHGELDDD